MNHMWSVRETNSLLPYAIIISNILEHFGVSMAGESKITLNARGSKIDVDVIHKMGFLSRPTLSNTFKSDDYGRVILASRLHLKSDGCH
ncbi:hypothetical protein Lal_00027108 [Lupinus albus]|nr:hypothetical protein Lal_00027108 [Lupinus albus]